MLPSIGPHHISSAVCLQSLHYTAMHDHNTWRDSGFSVCVPCSRSSAKFGLAYMRNKATASVLNRRTSELHAAGRGAHQCCLAQGIHRNLSQFVRGTEQVQKDSAWVLAPLWAFEDVRKIDFRHLCSQKPAERTALAMTVCQPQHGKTRHLPSPPLGALKRRSPLGLCSSFGSVCAHVAQIMPACRRMRSLGFPSPSPFAPPRPSARALPKTDSGRCMAQPRQTGGTGTVRLLRS